MVTPDNNANLLSAPHRTSSKPTTVRDFFVLWLSKGNAEELSPGVILSCLDKVSKYIADKSISSNIWEITEPEKYKLIYQKVLDQKLLRVTRHTLYKTFIKAGKLYMRFLEERPWESAPTLTDKNHASQLDTAESVKSGRTENIKTAGFLFNKSIDLSLFKYGFTIPVLTVDALCSNVSTEVPRGGNLRIRIIIEGKTHLATLCNVGFTSESKHAFQVRYTETSSIARALKNIFNINDLLAEKEEIKNRGYIEMVSVSTDTFELICHSSMARSLDRASSYEKKNGKALRPASRTTLKAAMIEYSNSHTGKTKTRQDICDELSTKYGFPKSLILPEIYKTGVSNQLPKLFRLISNDTYECLGYVDGRNDHSTINLKVSLPDEIGKKRAKHIIASKFKNGYRTTSNIDLERFKLYYEEEYSEAFESDAASLDAFLKQVAIVFDGRAYMYDKETVEDVRAYLNKVGSPCVYIDSFFEGHSEEFYNLGIFSVNMLRAFIQKTYADIYCKQDYVYLQSDVSPSGLIRKVFDERETWSLDELFDRLPHLKPDTIRATLNGSNYFRIETNLYTHIDNIDLPDREGENVANFVTERLARKDYVNANELDLSRFENLNPHCSFLAIRDAVFEKFLSKSFHKKGQIITRREKRLGVLEIIEQYCSEAETVSFEELNAFEASFDPRGRTHSTCLIAAHNIMLRVSADLFVKTNKVIFDVERTDEAIALYCPGNFIPLKNVVDFSLFPYAGFPWNLFLLESFVRKASHLFKYDVRAVNSANIGVIVRKSFTYSGYDDIMAIALAKSSLSLNDKSKVGDYLFDNGYIGWRNLGKNKGKILAAAKKVREGDTI